MPAEISRNQKQQPQHSPLVDRLGKTPARVPTTPVAAYLTRSYTKTKTRSGAPRPHERWTTVRAACTPVTSWTCSQVMGPLLPPRIKCSHPQHRISSKRAALGLAHPGWPIKPTPRRRRCGRGLAPAVADSSRRAPAGRACSQLPPRGGDRRRRWQPWLPRAVSRRVPPVSSATKPFVTWGQPRGWRRRWEGLGQK